MALYSFLLQTLGVPPPPETTPWSLGVHKTGLPWRLQAMQGKSRWGRWWQEDAGCYSVCGGAIRFVGCYSVCATSHSHENQGQGPSCQPSSPKVTSMKQSQSARGETFRKKKNQRKPSLIPQIYYCELPAGFIALSWERICPPQDIC